jgi:hypothetical protein
MDFFNFTEEEEQIFLFRGLVGIIRVTVDRKKTSEKNSVLENGKMVTASSH